MFEQIISIAEKLEDKKFLVVLRRILNVLFISNITSVLFEKFYYKYSLLDLADYTGIIDFFIKGQYIIPLIIFFHVWLLTWIIGYFGFSLYHLKIVEKYKSRILGMSFQQDKLDNTNIELEKNIPYKINEKWYLSLYIEIKKSFNQDNKRKILKALNNAKEIVIQNFILLIRALFTVILLFIFLPDFNTFLFIIVIITVIITTILLSWGYRILEVLPVLFQKAAFEFEKMLQKDNN